MLLLHVEKEITREAVLTLAILTASILGILAVQHQVAEQEMAAILFFSTISQSPPWGASFGWRPEFMRVAHTAASVCCSSFRT
jgi:hypothetical protein